MIVIVILAVIYVISVIVSYKVTRAWHVKYREDPGVFDVLFVFIPVFNVIPVISFGVDLMDGKYARKLFRMDGREEE